MNDKELLEKKYKEELMKEITNRFNCHCESIDNCRECKYNEKIYGNYQFEDRHICLNKFIFENYNISRKMK